MRLRTLVVSILVGILPAYSAVAELKLRIGVIAPLSGAYASFGEQIRQGMALAAGDSAELIYEDSQFDPKLALSAFQKLTAVDKIELLVSAGGSTCGVINREAQRKQILHIALGCNTEEFGQPDSYNFRLDVNEAIAAKTLAEFLRSVGVSRVAVINIENSWGTTVSKFAIRAFKLAGIVVTNQVTYLPTDAGNLRTEILKLSRSAPQRIFAVGSPESFAVMLKQLSELHITIPVVSTISVENPQFIELAGKLADGVVYLSVKKNSETAATHPEFFQRFPENNTFTAWGYDAISLLLKAKRSGSAKDYLQQLKGFIGAYNSYTFDQYGELHFEYEMREIRGGRYLPIVVAK